MDLVISIHYNQKACQIHVSEGVLKRFKPRLREIEHKYPQMRALKTENRELPPNPSQQPSSSRRKRSSQPSSELSSSKECLVAEKEREKERKWEKRKLRGNCRPWFCIAELIDSKFVHTEAYIGAQYMGNYQKKKTKPKAITGIISEETKKNANRAQRQKVGTGSRMNSALEA